MNLKQIAPVQWILAALILGFVAYYAAIQPLSTFGEGHPYDAESYFVMAQQVSVGEPIVEQRPFVHRVALPYLVGKLFPDNIMLGFKAINLLFAFATLVLLFHFLRFYIKSVTVVLCLLLLYVSSPISSFRFLHFIPVFTDTPALFFMLLLLHINNKIERLNLASCAAISLIGFVGVLFREIVLCSMLVLAFNQGLEFARKVPFLRIKSLDQIAYGIVVLAACAAGLWVTHGLVEGAGPYTYSQSIVQIIYTLWMQPLIYPLAWLVAYGAIPILLVFGFNSEMRDFLQNNVSITLFIIGIAMLAMVAGYHTDRFLYWAYPAVLVMFGKFLCSSRIVAAPLFWKFFIFAPMIVVQILSSRALLPIPDDLAGALFDPGKADRLLFAAYGETANFGQTYAASMLRENRITLLLQFTGYAAYTALVMMLFSRQSLQGAKVTKE